MQITPVSTARPHSTPVGRKRIAKDAIADEKVEGGWQALPAKVVKSAGRALQILEFFDDVRREANVVEISGALGYPQSSASTLLRSLVTLGYLEYNRRGRTYLPSMRVRLLGSWISPLLFHNGKILQLMEEMNEATGDLVMLATRNHNYAQYIHVVQATTALRVHLTPGLLRPLAMSGTGWNFLTELTETEIGKIVRRNNAEAKSKNETIQLSHVTARVQEVREKGYSFYPSLVTPGATIFAMMLPRDLTEQPLVLATGSPTSDVKGREQFVVDTARSLINRYLRR